MTILLILIGYFIGGIPFSYLIGKYCYKIDLRSFGSGNLGTTNAYRAMGLKTAAVILLLDLLKCYIPMVLVIRFLSFNDGLIIGLAICVGHCFSPYLQFKGGKAIATSAGFLIATDYRILIGLITLQFLLLFLTRKMSIASLVNALCYPICVFLIHGISPLFYASIFLSVFVLFMHRGNFLRLLQRKEKDLF